jgi:outer membrane lipoprotein
MKRLMIGRRVFLSLILILPLFLAACGPKVIPKEMEERIDKQLTFDEVKRDPGAFKGKRILVGGEIIETRNLGGKTEIEILQKPLGRDREPLPVDSSDGRFLLVHPAFLDPSVFRSGRRVTAVGVVDGSRSQKIGETEMIYPIFENEHIHLWPVGSGRSSEPSFGISLGFGAIFGR